MTIRRVTGHWVPAGPSSARSSKKAHDQCPRSKSYLVRAVAGHLGRWVMAANRDPATFSLATKPENSVWLHIPMESYQPFQRKTAAGHNGKSVPTDHLQAPGA